MTTQQIVIDFETEKLELLRDGLPVSSEETMKIIGQLTAYRDNVDDLIAEAFNRGVEEGRASEE